MQSDLDRLRGPEDGATDVVFDPADSFSLQKLGTPYDEEEPLMKRRIQRQQTAESANRRFRARSHGQAVAESTQRNSTSYGQTRKKDFPQVVKGTTYGASSVSHTQTVLDKYRAVNKRYE